MEVDCVMLMEAIVIVEGFFLRDVLNFDTNWVMNDV
jgi:hypothetical protein